MPFSFADAYARQVRQRLEQEKPPGRQPSPPPEANENLPRVSPKKASGASKSSSRVKKG